MEGSREVVRTTCPRDCYDACGIAVVKRNGQITRVLGDRDHPVSRGALCGKCALAYNGAWRDPAVRLQYPLRRTGKKGSGQFERVSWDAALAEIAERLQHILKTGDPGSVLHTHYTGTCSLIAGNFPTRFFHYLGATEVDPDTVCNKAGHLALAYMFGTSLQGFDPRTAKDARTIVVWGANPSASAPHAHKHWLREFPGTVIAIDPIRHDTAKQAHLHLQLKPGSDSALAFTMMNEALHAGLIDEAFLSAHALGWEELKPAVLECTLEWGAARTGLAPELIARAAREYAQGPALIWLGQGMQRQPMGGNAFRSVAALCAATGNIGKPGAGFLYMNGPETRGVDLSMMAAPELARDGPRSVSHMDLAAILADPARSRALFTWNNNILASSPQQSRLRAALTRDDLLLVCADIFATDTTDYADFVLPAANFLEFDDLVFSYFHHTVSAQVKAADPPGEALPNQEIFRRLARAMRFDDPALFESDPMLMAEILGATGLEIDFARLAEAGTVEFSATPLVQFDGLRFPTPSGKIEIASAAAERDGHPRVPFPHADEAPDDGRFRVLSPADAWLLNSSYANDAKIRERLRSAGAVLHPDDAARYGITEGMPIRLVNETGELPMVARLSTDVTPHTILVSKGRWPKYDPSHANVNVLNPGDKTDIGESSCVHSVRVEIRIPTTA